MVALALAVGPGSALAGTSRSSAGDPPAGEIAGQSFHLAPGITVPVSEIMARSRAQSRDGRGAPFVNPAPGERAAPPSGGGSATAPAPGHSAPGQRIATPTVGSSFLGPQLSESGAVPPDSVGDVGPSQVFTAANGRFKVFDKAGNLGGLNVDPDVFFSSVLTPGGCNFTSDPHVRYDRLSGRWFITMIDVPGCVGDQVNRVMIAVSSGPTITNSSSFTFYEFSAPAGQFADYDTLGVDANALYIGANMFSTGGPFTGTDGWVVRKSDLVAGVPPLVTLFAGLATGLGAGPFTPQGVDNDTPGAAEGYFVGVDNAVFSQLDIRRVSNPGSAMPTISGNLNVAVPTTRFPIDVPAQGTTTRLDALDDRLFAAMIAKDPATGTPRLWTSHNIQVDATGTGSGTGGRDGLRWYELGSLATTPALVQSGTVFDSAASNPAFYWIPSIAANGAGQAVVASTTAGTGRFAQVAAAQRFPSDGAGFMSAPTVVQASTSPYNVTVTNPQRWGDYSQTVVDPTDNQTFWTFQEYANGTNSWGVRAIQLKAPPPATPSSASPSSVAAGQPSVNVTITGASSNDSGFFDPGPDAGGPGFANHISASVTGGATVNSVTFTDRTHVTLDLNTNGASNGAKDVTITNPDGQSATGIGVLTTTGAVAPPPPTVSSTSPPSPANDNSPEVIGSAQAGTTVDLYANASCTGAPLGTGSAATFASPGVSASVADDSTTTIYATATAGALVSPCSSSFVTYVEDSTPPPAPTVSSTNPPSPANDNAPKVIGSAQAGSAVKLYTNPSCSPIAASVATGSAASFAAPGLTVSVADNSTITFYATATDPAGNVSPCSASSVTYVEVSSPPPPPPDVTAPETTITGGPPAKTRKKTATFTFTSSEAGSHFECKLDAGSFAACSSPDVLSKLKKGKHTFAVRAIDAAGNVDQSPATQTWKVKKRRRHHHHHHHHHHH